MENYQITLSENILSRAKLGLDCDSLRKELYYIKPSVLEKNLATDDLKKIFWTNIYNAFVLIIASEPKPKKSILKYKRIKVAFCLFSLDDIEYGILRMYKYKIGSFYFGKPFYSDFIKKLALKEIDYSTHFALDRKVLKEKICNFSRTTNS
jgi:hypothetical protein